PVKRLYPTVVPKGTSGGFHGYEVGGSMGALSDVAIRGWIKSGQRFEGKSDGDGLYLRFRKADAAPRWLFRYQFAGKARVMHLGSYRVLSLADARRTAKEMKAR